VNRGGFGRRFLFAPQSEQQVVEGEAPAAGEHEREADGEHRQRQLDPAKSDEGPDSIRRRSEQGVGELDHERRDEHGGGEEEGIDTGEQSGDEEDRAGELGPGGDMAEDRGDAVVRGDVGGERGRASLSHDLSPAVREEDQSRDDAQQQRGGIPGHQPSFRQRAALFDRVVAPLILFGAFYVATLIVLTWGGFPFVQWAGLIAVAVATGVTVLIWDRGQWPLGLLVRPGLAIPEFLLGGVWGALLVGAGALLVVLSTDVRHEPGAGFPLLEVALVYLPAAIHEELLFRGYMFQKLHRWNRLVALLLVALLFAALHFNNAAVSWIGLANIFLGGVLLGLAYERYGRLWFPIGLHLAWNVVSGPILGHEVSGYESMATLFVERGNGSLLLTGGDFGIEGSIWMTVTELVGIVLLWGREKRKEERGKRSIVVT
jgi:membrane protease YdiL (CAAX protease family)